MQEDHSILMGTVKLKDQPRYHLLFLLGAPLKS